MKSRDGAGHPETVYVKLGGSLITDKTRPMTARPHVLHRLAGEIWAALADRPQIKLLLGHGSGSFGHVVGQKYNVRAGVKDARGWEGYARTAAAAARLNRIVTDIFLEEQVMVVSLPPSASAWCYDGALVHLETRPVRRLLEVGVVPLVFGDVALDAVRGGTIVSTEEVFAFLALQPPPLRPDRILLVGEVAGVYSADPHKVADAELIPLLTVEDIEGLVGLTGSHAVDVTGGMATKVRSMTTLLQHLPHLHIQIFSGLEEGNLYRALVEPGASLGTRIVAGA